MAGRVAPPAAGGYPAAFRALVISSAQAMLRLAQQANPVLAAGDREQVLHVLGYALALPEAWPVTRELLLCLAPQMEQAGLRDEWAPFMERGISLSTQNADHSAYAELNLHLGFLYRLHGKWDDALHRLQLSAHEYALVGNLNQQAKAMSRASFVLRLQGDLEAAGGLVGQAQALCEPNSEANASCHSVQGALALDKREWHTAQKHFEQALQLWRHYGNKRMIAWSLGDLGICHKMLKQFADSLATLRAAINMFQDIQDPIQMAVTQMHLGLVYTDLDQYHESLALYASAERTFLRSHDSLRLAMLENNRGFAYKNLENWTQAEIAYQKSIELWKPLQDTYSLANVLDGLGVVYLSQGINQKAIQVFEEALQVLSQTKVIADQGYLQAMIRKHLDLAHAGLL
ncbi:MAG: tetratricopeptide repeat protein [Caldilineaceae bacterium]